ncbi:hypothetical protein CLU79DRAFT_751122 [Phycomyces nitens]|nr:hypothetical protein CLU79DRAFT_751122 [Phycomyces nitens]
MSTIQEIPVIDFSLFETDPQKCSQLVFDAAKNVGFFYLRNFGIPVEKVKEIFGMSKNFFELSKEEKLKYAIDVKGNLGYSAMRQEVADPGKHTKGDCKESFHIAKLNKTNAPQPLPDMFTSNKNDVGQFITACHTLVGKILICLGTGLEIPESKGGKMWFHDRHPFEGPSNDVLRLLHYPALDHANETDDIRIGRHSDYGSLTLLFQNEVGGLEVEKGPGGEWLSAPVMPDCVTVNLGDCLEYWTKGLLRSTKHRVVFKPETQTKPRYSMAYFCQGGPALLEPVPSKWIPVDADTKTELPKDKQILTASDHLIHKLTTTYIY